MNKDMQIKWEILQKFKETARYWLFWKATNRFWLNGFEASDGMIVVDSETKKIIYFLDQRYLQEAKDLQIQGEIVDLHKFPAYWKELNGGIKIESDLPFALVKNLQYLNQKLKFQFFNYQQLRMIKTNAEIQKLRSACQKTVQVWKLINENITKWKSEQEIAFFIQKELLNRECKISFEPIIASGKRSAYIHTTPTTEKIADILLCDFGAKEKKYCADFTRTVILNPSSTLQKDAKKLMQIYFELLKMLKPGVKIKTLVEKCKMRFAEENWSLQHALGHGIGLDVHEEPALLEHSDLVLTENMVIALEPGVYFPQRGGIRHEDTILITKTGYEILTKSD